MKMLALWNQFDDLFGDEHARLQRPTRSFVPSVDINETKEGYVLTADLPGLSANDVDITVEQGVLVLSGTRPAPKSAKEDGYHRVERKFGDFRRSFTLPKGVDVDGVSAKTEHGQVRITIPKPVAALPRKIKISSEEATSA